MQVTEPTLKERERKKTYPYLSHSKHQGQKPLAAPQHRVLREDSGILLWLYAWNMKATWQETSQTLLPLTSWKNPGQSSNRDTMLQKCALHLDIYLAIFKYLKIPCKNLYIHLPIQVHQVNKGRHPRLKLLHPGHEPASVCSQKWLSSPILPKNYL